jgi:hypothetical protein
MSDCPPQRTYILPPVTPDGSLPDVPPTDDPILAAFLDALKKKLEGGGAPIIPGAISGFTATMKPSGVLLTWNQEGKSVFFVINRNNVNSFATSKIVCAMYADSGAPSFFDVGGQDSPGADRFYWLRGWSSTGNPGPISFLVSTDPGGGVIEVDSSGALDTSPALAVRVDGVTIIINSSNELEAVGGGFHPLDADFTIMAD